ncbi:MAG TPA: pseudouridine synthase [Dehalococcoidia bacterium]|nr:pseudouridine synthase [Dehalococcoidia bacterium]
MPSQPLIKLLTSSGIGSRRQVVALIKRGSIAVNREIVQSLTEPVDPVKDVITIDGKHTSVTAEPLIYLLLNKPKGVISSTRDKRGEKTVIDFLPEKYRHIRLYPVGRLDKDSTGLILLTNDGELTFRLTHPRFEQEKEYRVRIEQNLKPEDKMKLEKGINLDDGKTSPAEVKALKYPPFSYSVTIHEGKKRQVRRMFAALGYKVLELKRIRLGSLRLGTLPEGEIRELTPRQVQSLKRG